MKTQLVPLAFVSLVVGCGDFSHENVPTNQKNDGAAGAAKVAAPPGIAVRQGDIRVSVESYEIGKVRAKEVLDEVKLSKEELISVVVRIENLSNTKKVAYRTWGSEPTDFLSRAKARLTDEHGNTYNAVHFGALTEIVGRNSAASIYPGKSITDVLVFERPVEKAKTLKLELPASAFGGDGMLRLQISLKR